MNFTSKDGIQFELVETISQTKGKEIGKEDLNDILECLREHTAKQFMEFKVKEPSPAEKRGIRMNKERKDKIKEAQKVADELEQQLREEEANASQPKKVEIKKKTKAKKGNPYPKMITIAKDTGIKALNPDWVKWEKENK